MTLMSARRAATDSHRRPLLEVALARRAEDGPEPPGGGAAQLAEHGLERVGGVRVVDHHGERLAEVDALHAAGQPASAASRPRTALPRSAPVAQAAASAASALRTLNRPGQTAARTVAVPHGVTP